MIRVMSPIHLTDGVPLLKAAMAREGLSNADLERAVDAEGSGLITRWLKGDRRPGLQHAVKLRDLLAIPVDSWLDPDERIAIPACAESAA